MILYHTASEKFSKFLDRPTWFSLYEQDAYGWHHYSGDVENNITYRCEIEDPVITHEVFWAKIAKEIWPDAPIYSMFDKRIGEFGESEIEEFIRRLHEDQGFDGAYMTDYDPMNYEGGGNTTSLCIFKPAKSIKILGEHSFKLA